MENVKKYTAVLVVGGFLAFLLLVCIWLAANYNSLVSAREDVENSWAKVDTQLERRFALIDNLVESTKGSQLQEQKVFGDIAAARSQYQNASTQDEQASAATNMTTAFAVLPKLQEAYPELRSNENIQKLMDELRNTENQIVTVRDQYNDTVTNYNKNIQRFPKSIFAGMFNFSEKQQFKATTGAETAPKVRF